jgi:branched-chain amino acid transport system permease protein
VKRYHIVTAGIVVAVLAALPLVVSDQFLLNNAILVVMFVGLTVAWNIAAFGGALSLGHAAFFGLGSYTSALLLIRFDINPWIGMVAAVFVAALGGLVLSLPLLRLRGPFFTLSSLAFVEVLRLLSVYARGITGGSEGLTVPSRPGWLYMSFIEREPYYYIVLVMSVVTVVISAAIYYSWIGYQLRASGSDDEAVKALGVRSSRLKVFALVVSAAITGAFGAFAAQYFFIIDPDTNFSYVLYSLQPAMNGIVGGMGTVLGPILGAVLMTPLGEYLRSAFAEQQGLSFIIYGVVLILVVMVMPGGLMSAIRKVTERLSRLRRSGRPGGLGRKRPTAVAEEKVSAKDAEAAPEFAESLTTTEEVRS